MLSYAYNFKERGFSINGGVIMFGTKYVAPMPRDLDFIFYNRALTKEELTRLGRMPTREELLAVWETNQHGNTRKFEHYEYKIMGKRDPNVTPWSHFLLAGILGVLIGLFAPAGVPVLLWVFSRRK